ncbi:FimV/HubP family polar landmark protein [Leucothrix mucor]|uniref:FimV/HubP family polar landmark protein n=1 Tax=Leucothrix mucor TaxID=45248 RepID=UPI0003B53E01|nr:FimV/HubP family polar landmark protein [Leucothrix mucor]
MTMITSLQNISLKPLASGLAFALIAGLSSPAFADQVYGPVASKDTLGKIVNRFYVGPNRSTIQLMRDIVQKNPQAFISGNMNRLKLNALLTLPGDEWLVNEPRFRTPGAQAAAVAIANSRSIPVSIAKTVSADLPTDKMRSRLVFLEAERSSLISQVAELERETERLEAVIKQLEINSRASDEQLRALDIEISRLTKLLEGKQGVPLASGEVMQLSALQDRLEAVQNETQSLRRELSKANTELANNAFLKQQADETITKLTQENRQLHHLLQDTQPGVNYFGEKSEEYQLSFFDGKLQFPLWMAIVGGALLSVMMITLLATRRKNRSPEPEPTDALNDSTPANYNDLLSGHTDHIDPEINPEIPEENVFKMFDEGSLEVELKLDMAEAYLEVSDFDSARNILEEVMETGSEMQQRKAARLLKQAA